MLRSRSLRFRIRDRPGHGTVPRLVTSLRRPLRHVSVPRSVVFPVQLRSFCVQGPGPRGVVTLPASGTSGPRFSPSNRRDRRSRSAPGPPMPHRHATAFSSRRRTIFCTGPMTGICVVPPSPAPAPPRRIAMRCSRCGTRVILAQFRGTWKIGVKPLATLKKSLTLLLGAVTLGGGGNVLSCIAANRLIRSQTGKKTVAQPSPRRILTRDGCAHALARPPGGRE
jgi:hypothetical protein